MTTASRRPVVLRLITAFVIGFVSLTLEIAYTRVISFKLFYYYTYFVIGLALLGLGAASAFVALSRRLRSIDTVRLVQRVAPVAAGIGVVGYAIVARLATDVNLIWTGSLAQAAWQLALLVVLSVCCSPRWWSARPTRCAGCTSGTSPVRPVAACWPCRWRPRWARRQ